MLAAGRHVIATSGLYMYHQTRNMQGRIQVPDAQGDGVCVCVFKAPRTYTPVLGDVLGVLVSPALGTR